MALSVSPATDDDIRRWNGFLADQPMAPPYCDFRWAAVLKTVFGVSPRFLMATDDLGAVEGVLPVYVTRSLRGRRRLYSLNRGLVAPSPAAENALLGWLHEHWRDMSLSSAVISSPSAPRTGGAETTNKAAVILPLADKAEDTWRQLRAKTRNMIRKAEKAGLAAEHGFHNLQPFYEIYAERMLSLGVPIYGFALFEAIARIFENGAELIVAKSGDEVVAGILLVYGGQTAAYPFQATATRHMATAATQFLIWQAVESATKRGIGRIDMGESQPQSPVYMSKINFGGVPEDVFYSALSAPVEDGGIDRHAEAGRARPSQSKPSRLGRSIDVVMNTSPMWIRRPFGLWLKRRGRLLF